MKRITDPEFRYTPSNETDLRKTFARIRREQKRQDAKEREAKVMPLAVKKVVAP